MATATKSAIAAALHVRATSGEDRAPAPPVPAGEVGAVEMTPQPQQQQQAPPADDASGLDIASGIARFYARALAPTAVLVLWMFTIYAGLAYLVPHVLCEDTVTSLPVRAVRGGEVERWRWVHSALRRRPTLHTRTKKKKQTGGFKECVYPTRSSYPLLRTPTKVFMTIVWAAMNAWLVLYMGLMGRAMFSHGFTRAHTLAVAAVGAALAAAVAAAPALGNGLNDASYIVATLVTALVPTFAVGHALSRATGDRLDIVRWFAMMATAAVAVLIYQIYMPEIITRRSLGKPWHLLAARMGAHPFIWAAITEMFMHTGRYVGRTQPLMHATMFVWPAMYGAVYGRFLLAQLDTAGSVAALNVQLALVGLAGRLGARGVSWPLKLMYGGRTAEAYEASADARQLRVTRWLVNIMAEHAGIVCSAAIYTFGAVSRALLRDFSFFFAGRGQVCARPSPVHRLSWSLCRLCLSLTHTHTSRRPGSLPHPGRLDDRHVADLDRPGRRRRRPGHRLGVPRRRPPPALAQLGPRAVHGRHGSPHHRGWRPHLPGADHAVLPGHPA
jgi:hypothetical protein